MIIKSQTTMRSHDFGPPDPRTDLPLGHADEDAEQQRSERRSARRTFSTRSVKSRVQPAQPMPG